MLIIVSEFVFAERNRKVVFFEAENSIFAPNHVWGLEPNEND